MQRIRENEQRTNKILNKYENKKDRINAHQTALVVNCWALVILLGKSMHIWERALIKSRMNTQNPNPHN